MIGLASFPERTLVERALALMLQGPLDADRIAAEVLGLAGAPRAVAERLAVALFSADPRVRQLEDGRWALVAEAHGSPLLEECGFAVVDVETTGMRASGPDRITDIAVVVVHGNRRELVYETLVNPGVPIPLRIQGLTGITDRMVAAAPTFEQVADEVLAALAGRVFVAHNARFDWGFVAAEVRRARAYGLTAMQVCTVRLARRLLPQLESRSLDSLSLFFGLENQARHRAAGDAQVTAVVLERLLQLAREAGARTLADLEGMTRAKNGKREPGNGAPASRPELRPGM
ncbi:MAG: 3'-5' exonuclease [Gemmatimonadota bacterium]|nr:3'-5' exonuclease [Gemmatimonadota bacterium]